MGQEASKRVWESTYKTLTRRKRLRQPQSSSSWTWECRRPKNCGYDQEQPGQGQRRTVKVTSLNDWLTAGKHWEREGNGASDTKGSLRGRDPSLLQELHQLERASPPTRAFNLLEQIQLHTLAFGIWISNKCFNAQEPANKHLWCVPCRRNTARWSLPRAGATGLLCWMSFAR